MDKDKLLGTTSEPKMLDGVANRLDTTLLWRQRGLQHLIKSFAWYVALLVAIVGVAFAFGAIVGADITSQAYWLDVLLFMSGAMIVYTAFFSDGRESGRQAQIYIDIKTKYNNAREKVNRMQVQTYLTKLAEQDKQAFITRICKQVDLTLEQIEAINTGDKTIRHKYKRKTLLQIRMIQQHEYPTHYTNNPDILFNVLAQDMQAFKKFDPNAEKKYIYKSFVTKFLVTLVMLCISGSVVISTADKSTIEIITQIVTTLLAIGVSITSGYSRGKRSITINKVGVLEYVTDILERVSVENKEQATEIVKDTSNGSQCLEVE